jgi:hypothetical protein
MFYALQNYYQIDMHIPRFSILKNPWNDIQCSRLYFSLILIYIVAHSTFKIMLVTLNDRIIKV